VATQYGLVFPLPEELRTIYLSFGIDLERHHGNASWTLPMPATYLINREGVIHDAVVSVDYTTRPEPSETLKKLDSLITQA
jgi:peroxiredoxin